MQLMNSEPEIHAAKPLVPALKNQKFPLEC